MTRRIRCVHRRSLGAVSQDGNVNILAQFLRVTGSCPDCPDSDGTAKLAILRALPATHDLTWVASSENIGALVHVEIEPKTWRGRFPGNIGMPHHFVGRFCRQEDGLWRFQTAPGVTVTLRPRNMRSAEILIPACSLQEDHWEVGGLTFGLTPPPIVQAEPQPALVAV